MRIADYRRVVDPLVKPAEFRSNWPLFVHTVAHFAFVTAVSLWVARHVGAWPLWQVLAIALLTGHSVACLGFCSHELGHGVATRSKLATYLWETFAWIYSLTICASIHRKAHFLHHAYLNSPKDPNGRPTLDEIRADPGKDISEWLFPNSKHPRASAFLGLWLVNLVYQMKLLSHSVLATGARFDMRIPRWQAWAGVAETFVLNLGVYLALWAAAGFRWEMGLYLAVMNYVGTTIGLAYICTNHLLNPALEDHVDPLALSLTVRVPAWADFFHVRFSHHNEHHLYPKAGPANYPAIRRALKERFADRYNELSFLEAYREILRSPIAHLDAQTLADVHGESTRRVAFPAPEARVEPALQGS